MARLFYEGRWLGFACAAFSVALATGCSGNVLSPGGTSGGSDGDPSTHQPVPRRALLCDPTTRPPNVAWSRLSRSQVTSTVEALVGDAVPGLERLLSAIPLDITPYPTVAGPLSVEHLQAYANIAAAVADAVILEAGVRDRYLGCDISELDEPCARDFIQSFSEAAERARLPEAQLEARLDLFGTEAQAEDGLRLVVRTVLQAPRFLYRVEQGDPSTDEQGAWSLSSEEVAARISYGLLGEPSDGSLRGALADAPETTVRQSAAEALLGDPRARTHFREFIRHWLGLDQKGPPLFSETFLGGLDLSAQEDEDAFEQVAVDEVLSLAEHMAFDLRGTLADLLTTRLARPTDRRLAEVYGVTVATDWVELSEERAGILTRVGALYAGDDNENPIHRGLQVRTQLLCDELPPPPPDVTSQADAQRATLGQISTREWFEQLTASPTCMGCHSAINPLGHALGAFDGLGRLTTTDEIFESGSIIGRHPVDTQVNPRLSGPDEATINGGAELGAALASDPRSHECFASQLFHFTMGRPAEAGDGCALSEMTNALLEGSILDAWLALIAHDDFARRSVAGEDE